MFSSSHDKNKIKLKKRTEARRLRVQINAQPQLNLLHTILSVFFFRQKQWPISWI